MHIYSLYVHNNKQRPDMSDSKLHLSLQPQLGKKAISATSNKVQYCQLSIIPIKGENNI